MSGEIPFFQNQFPLLLNEGGRRLTPDEEVGIKADLTARSLHGLIDQFNQAETNEQRANLQQKITKIAQTASRILGSNEP